MIHTPKKDDIKINCPFRHILVYFGPQNQRFALSNWRIRFTTGFWINIFHRVFISHRMAFQYTNRVVKNTAHYAVCCIRTIFAGIIWISQLNPTLYEMLVVNIWRQVQRKVSKVWLCTLKPSSLKLKPGPKFSCLRICIWKEMLQEDVISCLLYAEKTGQICKAVGKLRNVIPVQNCPGVAWEFFISSYKEEEWNDWEIYLKESV